MLESADILQSTSLSVVCQSATFSRKQREALHLWIWNITPKVISRPAANQQEVLLFAICVVTSLFHWGTVHIN